MNIYEYLNNTYPDKWQTKNFNMIDIQAESLLIGSIELVLNERSIVGCATVYKDFSIDVTQNLKIACIKDALSCIPSPVRQYTKEQLDAIAEFKQKHDIDSNDKVNSYVNTWRPGCTVDDLNPDNVDEFLNYISTLERK